MPDDKKPKPRFKERDDVDDADDDRPRKKKRAAEEDDANADDAPRKKKRRDDDEPDDDRPKKKKKPAADDGPRVEASERTPVLMLVALLGSALALFSVCAVGGWWSWVMLVAGGDFGGGSSGSVNDAEVGSVIRSVQRVGFSRNTTYKVTIRAKQNLSREYLVLVVQARDGTTQIAQFGGMDKGLEWSGEVSFFGQEVTQADVWVERRAYAGDQRGARISDIKTVR